MKKKNKLSILTTGIVSGLPAMVVPILSTSGNDVKVNKNSNSLTTMRNNVSFNGNNYDSADAAIQDVLKKNVETKEYLGDVDTATSTSNQNAIDLSRLVEKNGETINKMTKAYKTLSGSYTSDYREAQKSYVKDAVYSYVDSNGKSYDSQNDALNVMKNNIDSYSNTIGYYTVKDYSQKGKEVNINPLNSTDVKTLKQIAIKNISNTNSSFTLNRYVAGTDGKYQKNNFQGKTDLEIQTLINNIEKGVTDIVKNNMWINTNLSVVPDKTTVGMKYRKAFLGSYTTYTDTVKFNWTIKETGNSNGSYYSDIIKDSDYLTTYNKMLNKFNVTYPGMGWKYGYWQPYQNLQSTNKIFGKTFDISLDNGQNIFKKHDYYYKTKDQAGFLGTGKLVNATFGLGFNQSNFKSKMDNDSSFKKDMETKASDVKTKVETYLKAELSKAGTIDTSTQTLISSIGDTAKNLILTDVIGNTNLSVSSVKSSDQVKVQLDKINDMLLTKFDATNTKLTTTISNHLHNAYQRTESTTITDNNVIYTIDYNGVPLFRVSKELYKDIINSDSSFKVNPVDSLKKYLSTTVLSQATSTSAWDKIYKNLVNVSNLLDLDKTTYTGFTKNSIDKYGESGGKQDVTLDSSTISQLDVKKVSSNYLSNTGISEAQLKKSLNINEQNDIGYLNSTFGTYQAIYEYNKTLEKYSKLSTISDNLKKDTKDNAISDADSIILLYGSDKTPLNIKFGSYLNFGYQFNPSLSTNEHDIYNSKEKLTNDFIAKNLGSPKKKVTFSDYDGTVLASEVIDSVDGNYQTAVEQVYQNAINKVQVPSQSEYIFYRNDDETQTLIKNVSTKLYVLTLTVSENTNSIAQSATTNTRSDIATRATKTIQYGFEKYADLTSYVRDAVYLENNITNPTNPTDGDKNSSTGVTNSVVIAQGINIALIVILVAEVVFLSLYIYSKFKKKNNVNSNKLISVK